MIDLESKFEALEEEVKEIKGNTQQLKKGLLDLTELNYILHKTQGFFEEVANCSGQLLMHQYSVASTWCVVT